MSAYGDFVRSLQLRHFQPSEFLVGMDRGNSMPPRELWPNIALTAVILDKVRAEFRRPITITSAYRSPTYNRRIGGSRRSQHMAFTACDFKVKGVAPSRVAELLLKWRQQPTLFRLPVVVVRVRFKGPAGPAPFGEIETWEMTRSAEQGSLVLGGGPSMMKFAGGVGRYDTFTHLDTRGVNATWNG